MLNLAINIFEDYFRKGHRQSVFLLHPNEQVATNCVSERRYVRQKLPSLRMLVAIGFAFVFYVSFFAIGLAINSCSEFSLIESSGLGMMELPAGKLTMGLEMTPRQMELREDGTPRESVKPDSTKWNIVQRIAS